MELLDGSTLRDELDNTPSKQLPAEKVKIILQQLVSALEAIHSQGIYHLDISPDNIQLKKAGQVVLIDFGAARQGLSSSTTRAFKLAYAAPEVLAGTHVGPQSDLFELAMMTGEMLSGVLPPSVLERMAGVTLNLSALDEGWRNLLNVALRMEIEGRPASVESWWKSFRETRASVVLTAPKLIKQPPVRKAVILPRNAKPKLRFKPEVKKARRLESLKPSDPGRVRGVPHESSTPPQDAEYSAKDNKTLIAFVLGIVGSCVVGLGAYFVSLGLFQPVSSSTQGDYDQQHKYVQIINIFIFGLVSLVTFFIFVVWFFKLRKKKNKLN
jgi:serine/threonine protein kinase